MKVTFGEIITEVLKHEGGFVDDDLDRGGQTAYGISKRAHPDVDIKKLTVEDAISIYREHYWIPSKAERLPERLRLPYFVFLVNSGQGNAVKVLQKACNSKNGKGEQISVDGRIGRMTIRASQKLEPQRLQSYIILYYANIVIKNSTQERFWFGWYRRALESVI
jgi:lysozyme family protein